jgi:hypothetical protein
MAKIAYRLYVHDEEVPMMQAKIISSFGPSRRHSRRTTTTTQEEGEEDEEDNKYHSLVDLIWEFRASMQVKSFLLSAYYRSNNLNMDCCCVAGRVR